MIALVPEPILKEMNDLENMLARYKRAESIKELWRPTFEECYEYSMPARESFYPVSAGQAKTDKIFDETAVVGVQEFASRLQAGIVPNFARWAELISGSEIPMEERKEVNESLDSVTNYIFEMLQNSNFAQEVHESFLDLAVGTGALLIEEGDAVRPIRFSAIPLSRLCLDTGPNDVIDTIYRTRKIKASNIKLIYPNATLPPEIARQLANGNDAFLQIVECVSRNYSTPNVEKYDCTIFGTNPQHIYDKKVFEGEGSNPYVVFRWSKAAGEVYGRGPLLNSLPAVKTCNLVIEMILENAQMQISGMYQIEDDGIINVDTIQLLPGTIIPRSPSSRGLEPIAPAGNFNVADLVLKDMRTNIKRALYNEMLGDPNTTPMSATEVAERMADLSRQIGSSFGRLQAEMVTPLLQRVIHILKKQGRINIPTVNGREVKVLSTSPLAQAQANQDISGFNRFLELVQARFGPQLVNLLVDNNEATKYLAEKFGIPSRLIRSKEQMNQAIAELTNAVQQQQEMQQQMAQQGNEGQQETPIS
tara:strand:- start:1219 stop:2820 length:1602 start_codon:yes stop_codon:yes gene_type:complete